MFILEKLNVNPTEYSDKLKTINAIINTESSLVELIKFSNTLSELDMHIKQQHESLKMWVWALPNELKGIIKVVY